MAAEVESMFYVREKPWHGLGTKVEFALSAEEALEAAGLNWNVLQKKIWLLAKLPKKYRIMDDKVIPYLVFCNSHDGTGAIKVAMTPIRVVCNNTLNLALDTAKRVWLANHTGNMDAKMEDAKMTLYMVDDYMNELDKSSKLLNQKKLSDAAVKEYIKLLLPIAQDASEITERNVISMRENMKKRYFQAPDLINVGKNAYRFINAVYIMRLMR